MQGLHLRWSQTVSPPAQCPVMLAQINTHLRKEGWSSVRRGYLNVCGYRIAQVKRVLNHSTRASRTEGESQRGFSHVKFITVRIKGQLYVWKPTFVVTGHSQSVTAFHVSVITRNIIRKGRHWEPSNSYSVRGTIPYSLIPWKGGMLPDPCNASHADTHRHTHAFTCTVKEQNHSQTSVETTYRIHSMTTLNHLH